MRVVETLKVEMTPEFGDHNSDCRAEAMEARDCRARDCRADCRAEAWEARDCRAWDYRAEEAKAREARDCRARDCRAEEARDCRAEARDCRAEAKCRSSTKASMSRSGQT